MRAGRAQPGRVLRTFIPLIFIAIEMHLRRKNSLFLSRTPKDMLGSAAIHVDIIALL
jgi:hypothetical protein